MMDFRSTLLSFGLTPRDIVADGKFYRCATTDKPRKKNGAYMLRTCGTRGYFRNYAIDDNWHEWKDDIPLSPIARRRIDLDAQAMRVRERQRQLQSVILMRAYFFGLPPLRGGHPYLEKKGLSMQGCASLRVDGDKLVIPMARTGSLMSFQTITPNGQKKYRAGCPVRGAIYALTRKGAAVTCLTEGFATGLAVYQSMPQASVIVCFDANNLAQVATEMKLRGLVVVCADNDWQTEQRTGINTGITKGKSAAQALRCGLAYPDGIEGSDWADALLEWGSPVKVRMEIMKQARPVFG